MLHKKLQRTVLTMHHYDYEFAVKQNVST